MDILNFYYIDLKYIRNLSRADDNVMSVSPQVGKEKRPFLGIIILIGGQKYCIPLTSPKKKFENMKSQIDFIKVFDHNSKHPEYSSKIIGILNLNNMIPVNNSVISKVNLKLSPHDTPDKTKRKILMQKPTYIQLMNEDGSYKEPNMNQIIDAMNNRIQDIKNNRLLADKSNTDKYDNNVIEPKQDQRYTPMYIV